MKLYSKLLLAIIPAALLSAQAIIFYSRKATHTALISALGKTGIHKTMDLTTAMSPGFASKSESTLLPLLQSCQRATLALYVSALDNTGKVLSHTNVGEVGQQYNDQATLNALAAQAPLTQESRIKDQQVLDISIPVFDAAKQEGVEDFLFSEHSPGKGGRRIGTLQIGLPLDEALATERQISKKILWIVLLFSGSTILVLLLLMRSILLLPIKMLQVGTAKIRGGVYGTVIPILSNDEIGALGKSFNEMSATLAETTVSKDFFNNILNSIQDQVIVTDAEGRISLVNPSTLTLLGYAKDELTGKPASTLFDKESDIFVESNVKKLRSEGSLHNINARFITKKNEEIPILFSASTLRSKEGKITGFIGVAKDISDVKRLEARMHQSEKLSAVGQLAAGVAHEINNPLGVILGFAQGMSKQVKPGEALELPVKSIEREALRCKTLVQNLLTFARTSHSDRAAMDLNHTVEQALALIQAQAKMTQVQIKTTLAANLPLILGNKNQVEQVILNLAKNALDAMPNGGMLSLNTELIEQKPHSWVCLKISDTGTGIPPALMTKVFEPFFTTKPVGQGTGLGLSLVSEIVKKHSGDVEVESRPGNTVFIIKFPGRTGQEIEKRLIGLQQEKMPIGPPPHSG